MPGAIDALVRQLHYDLRIEVRNRITAMMREVRSMQDRADPRLERVLAIGWSMPRLEVLCGLNAFYQIVISPLAASAHNRSRIFEVDVTIRYGEALVFDIARRRRVRSAENDFLAIIAEAGLGPLVLYANHASDLIFALSISAEDDNA